MDVPKTNPLDDREFLDDSAQTFPLTVLMAFVVVFATLIILWWAKNRTNRSARRGECLLLCGISNSGKTVLFTRLVMGLVKRTLTSMAINRGTMKLDYLTQQDRPPKKVHVLDIPGNLRIRQRNFEANKTSAKAIIFLIDSTSIGEESKEVADYLFDILREKSFRQQRLPLLIFCNKQDANNTRSIQSIRALLENELTMKRKTRASSVAMHQGTNDQRIQHDDIGRSGKETFEFDDVKDLQIEFADGSALGVEKKQFAQQYDDEEGEEIDSGGDETDMDSGPNLLKVHEWIAKIWFK